MKKMSFIELIYRWLTNQWNSEKPDDSIIVREKEKEREEGRE